MSEFHIDLCSKWNLKLQQKLFNCSLKTEDKCSLNEAAYSGINLINNMIDLLLKFKKKYVMSGDIKKAFLMIKF